MNQKSSLREVPQLVSQVLTGNSIPPIHQNFLRQNTRGERLKFGPHALLWAGEDSYRRAKLLLLCGYSHNCKLAKTRAFAFQRILDTAHTARSTYPRFCKPKVGSSILSTGTSKKSLRYWHFLNFRRADSSD